MKLITCIEIIPQVNLKTGPFSENLCRNTELKNLSSYSVLSILAIAYRRMNLLSKALGIVLQTKLI